MIKTSRQLIGGTNNSKYYVIVRDGKTSPKHCKESLVRAFGKYTIYKRIHSKGIKSINLGYFLYYDVLQIDSSKNLEYLADKAFLANLKENNL